MAETTRVVRFYDCQGRETGPPVYAVGRNLDEYYANAARARDDWRATQATLKELDIWTKA